MKAFEKVKDLIAAVAPTLGTALGGPLGGLAGTMVQAALGADSPEQAVAILQSGDPAAILKMKEAQNNLLMFMRDADIREDQLVVEDRKDARGMAKALGTAGPQMFIVVALTLMISWVLWELFLEAPPKGSENVLFVMLGTLTNAWTAAISFFVGTTKSSSEKNETMKMMADK